MTEGKVALRKIIKGVADMHVTILLIIYYKSRISGIKSQNITTARDFGGVRMVIEVVKVMGDCCLIIMDAFLDLFLLLDTIIIYSYLILLNSDT